MARVRLAAFLFVVITLPGCLTTPPTTAEVGYGAPIERAEAERRAQEWLDANLREPRVEWLGFDRAWLWRGRFWGPNRGYGLYGEVNAQNGLGAYTGAEPSLFFFRDGELVSATKGVSSDVWAFARDEN